MTKPGRASGLLLGAVISIEILLSIIQDPFFAFGGSEKESYLLKAMDGTALRGMIEVIHKSDEAGAQGLRCQVLRLLDPPMSNVDPQITAAKKRAKNSRTVVSRRLARDLMMLALGSFNDADKQAALSALEVIFEEAAELSWTLWTRKARINIEYAQPGEVEHHTLHLRELDDDPEALEGRDIILLCDATVTILGDAEGEDFQKRRVVKKAVVWKG